MSAIGLVLTALIGVEAIPAALAWFRVARGAVTVAKVGAKALPTVMEGFRKLSQRENLDEDERAALATIQRKRVRDLGGPMDKFA